MSFQLSPGVDEKKVFVAKFSELSDRYDPDMVLFRRKIHGFRHPVERMHKFFSTSPQYGANEKGVERETSEEPRYVRITDINEYGLLSEELGATAETIEPQYLLQENDLLFARSGNTVGKSYIHKTANVDYPCFFAGYLIRLRFNEKRVLPDYIFALTQLPYYKSWVKAIQRASGQPNINAQEYSNLDVCIAPMPVQVQVVKRLDEAYAAKAKKDAQAKAQLAGIDALLLAELGITTAPALPNTIQNRIFIRQFSEVTGGRFAAPAHWKKLNLSSPIYPSVKLVDLVDINPTFSPNLQDEDEVSFVPMEAVSEISGQIASHYARLFGGAGTYTQFQEGDLLWAKITPCMENGKSAIATNLVNDFGFGSTEFHVFRPKTDAIDVRFLHALFRLQILRDHARLNFGGSAGHQRVDKDYFLKLSIPLPEIEEQRRICNAIDKAKIEATKLFAAAQSELEGARAEIEAMILGNPI